MVEKKAALMGKKKAVLMGKKKAVEMGEMKAGSTDVKRVAKRAVYSADSMDAMRVDKKGDSMDATKAVWKDMRMAEHWDALTAARKVAPMADEMDE